ncbi:unnamed protein product [Malus baccata var. baccata]
MWVFLAICSPADYNTLPLDTVYNNFIDALPVVGEVLLRKQQAVDSVFHWSLDTLGISQEHVN